MSHIIAILMVACCILLSGNAAASSSPDDDFTGNERKQGQLPSREEILNMLDSMTGISEEEKENLRRDLTNGFSGKQEVPSGIEENSHMQQTILLFSLLGLIALIFLFFTHKLYKSLTERERRRMEKKRLKEGKKKK